jgi:heme-degrading monooxygenase HmoA
MDSFLVPENARGAFLARVRTTHNLLRRQPGFVQDLLLEQPAENGRFRLVTLVEWRNADSMNDAREVIQTEHASEGFDRHEFIDRLGVSAEFASYRPATD